MSEDERATVEADLRACIRVLTAVIDTYRETAERLGVDVYGLQDANGSLLVAGPIAALANAHAALARLMEV